MERVEPEQLVSAIRRALNPRHEVQAAFLFGSHAMGRAREHSDIDVAVLLDPAHADRDARSQLRGLLAALASELAADRLDLVILNEAPPALAFQVLRHGRLALERDPCVLHRFRLRTYDLHSDFVPVERFFRDVTRRRALGEGNHG